MFNKFVILDKFLFLRKIILNPLQNMEQCDNISMLNKLVIFNKGQSPVIQRFQWCVVPPLKKSKWSPPPVDAGGTSCF